MEEELKEAVAEIESFPLHVEEFCSRLSSTDTRTEAIGAFHKLEKAAGRIMDDHTSFLARFEAFLKQPA